MKKDELIVHLRVSHLITIRYPSHYLKTVLDEIHRDEHVKERAASDAFIKTGKRA